MEHQRERERVRERGNKHDRVMGGEREREGVTCKNKEDRYKRK